MYVGATRAKPPSPDLGIVSGPPCAPDWGSGALLRVAEEAAGIGSWRHDCSTGETRWSHGMYAVLDVPPETTPGSAALLARVQLDDLPALLDERDRARCAGGRWEAEVRLNPTRPPERDGEGDPGKTVSIVGFVQLDDGGRSTITSGTVQDVSARASAERRLRVTSDRYRAAFDHAPIGISLIDARPGHPAKRMMANQALADLTGFSPAELRDRPLLDIVDPEQREEWGHLLEQIRAGEMGHLPTAETRILRPDGGQRWVSVSGHLVRDHEGRPAYIVAHLVDVTARKQVEEEARRVAARDARIATILQDGLVPHVPCQVGPLAVASRYRPHGDGELVGGDWSDVFALPNGRIGIAVGDVAGHGIGAAAAMARMRALVRMLATSGASPAGVMRRLNDVIHESAMGEEFDLATLVHAQLEPATGLLWYCSAGHLPMLALPARRSRQPRRVGPVPAVGGPPIGVTGGLRYTEEVVALEPGSTLIGYTDGLIERRDQSIDQSLLDLQDRVNTLDPPVQDDVRRLADALLDFALERRPGDDIGLLVLGFDPSTAPSIGAGRPPAAESFAVPSDRWTRG